MSDDGHSKAICSETLKWVISPDANEMIASGNHGKYTVVKNAKGHCAVWFDDDLLAVLKFENLSECNKFCEIHNRRQLSIHYRIEHPIIDLIFHLFTV